MSQNLVFGRPVNGRARAGKKLADERFEQLVFSHSGDCDAKRNSSAVKHELRCSSFQVVGSLNHDDSHLQSQLRHIARLVQGSEETGSHSVYA